MSGGCDGAREKGVSKWETVAREGCGHSFGDWLSRFSDAENLIAIHEHASLLTSLCTLHFRVLC